MKSFFVLGLLVVSCKKILQLIVEWEIWETSIHFLAGVFENSVSVKEYKCRKCLTWSRNKTGIGKIS